MRRAEARRDEPRRSDRREPVAPLRDRGNRAGLRRRAGAAAHPAHRLALSAVQQAQRVQAELGFFLDARRLHLDPADRDRHRPRRSCCGTTRTRSIPIGPIASDQPALEVQAVGLDWKWLFIYPDQRIAAINQLAIPVGRPDPYQPDQRHGDAVVADPPARRPDLRDGGDDDPAQSRRVPAGRLSRREHAVQRRRLPEREVQRRSRFRPPTIDRWVARVRASAHPLDAAAYAELFRSRRRRNRSSSRRSRRRLFQHILVQSQEPDR